MAQPSSREELEREGWTMRTVQNEPRLSELIEMYEEIGFEVKILPLSREDCGTCSVCFDNNKNQFKTIYTRPKKG